MAISPEEQVQKERFSEIYARAELPALRALERSVCGCDYGGTSWTTREEADRMAALLGLRPGLRLLEVGAGSGWPALYWAGSSGCDTTLVDLPLEAIRIAADRAASDGILGTCRFAVADGAALPFRDASFDAVSHTDVLCCLEDKRGILRSCRRVLRPGGRMVFSVISIVPGLSATAYERAVENGPPFVEAEAEYPALLHETGWAVATRIDVTADFAATCRRLIREERTQWAALRGAFAGETLAERQASQGAKLRALEDGVLRREIFDVVPPPA
jgi:SAM-dependent methyltransferase